jgi:1-acyl-sn-glycerol-3-phosphate acyltransferase
MPDNAVARRSITIPAVVVLFALMTALSPLLMVLGAVVDVVRAVASGKPWMTLRCLAFLWVYLLGQLWALVAVLATVPLSTRRKQTATWRVQGAWASWNFAALRGLFSLDLLVEGQEHVTPGPLVVLARHASMVDTMLPALLIANPFSIRLRYVLKKELLVDPTLDIGGHRLPNHFVERRSGESTTEMEAIGALASDLEVDEGVLIYPEGTRFSVAKRDRSTNRLRAQAGPLAAFADGFRRVLPPRPGGTLAILDATDADVVVLAHSGLEGLATARDIWSGGMVGSTIQVRLWRVARTEIPDGRRQRLEWLFRTWAEVDDWIVGTGELGVGASK